MLIGHAYFWACTLMAVLGAIFTVASKNPIRSAMGLLLMILNIAGLFLALHAQFLAAIQLIVYAGAIVVLFLFVIMLLGPAATSPSDQRGRIPRYAGAGLFGGLGLTGMWLVVKTAPKAEVLHDNVPSDFGGIDAFGRLLFNQALVPFELSSALLMVAVIGAVAVARGKQPHELGKAAPSTGSAKSEGGEP